ncbi:MAG: hypothetical protein ABH859_03200 [Pseudomonadota bacterium]
MSIFRITKFFFIIIFSLCLFSNKLIADWDKFSSKPGEFSVLMPCQPQLKSKVDQTIVGKIVEHTYSCKKDSINFVLEYQDLPPLAVDLGTRRRIYRNAQKAFLKEIKGEEISSKTVNLKNFPGVELTYKTKQEFGQARFFLVGKRLYVLQISGSHNADQSCFAKYLKSFNQKHRKLFKPARKFNKYHHLQSQHLH